MFSADVPLEPDIKNCIAIGSRVPSISWALLLVYEAGQFGAIQSNRRTHLAHIGISTLMLIEGIKYCERLSIGYKSGHPHA